MNAQNLNRHGHECQHTHQRELNANTSTDVTGPNARELVLLQDIDQDEHNNGESGCMDGGLGGLDSVKVM